MKRNRIRYYLAIIAISWVNAVQAQFTLQAGAGYSNYQWYIADGNGGTPIQGANTSSFIPVNPGVYFATFDGTDCGSNATEYFVLTANNDTNVVLKSQQSNVSYHWYKDNSLIPTANQDSLLIISNDTLSYYQAEIVQNNCSKRLPGFYVYHLGIWAPLPIELVSFTALLSINNEKVVCNWKTRAEINSSYFTVEKSRDLLRWEIVAQIPATGNSVEEHEYSTLDNTPYLGRSYYRLKMTSLDQTVTYSQVESIFIRKAVVNPVRIYPNPFKNKITIEGPEEEFEKLKIYNVLGGMIRSVHFKEQKISNTKKELDVSSLATGIYFISTKSTHTKVIKVD